MVKDTQKLCWLLSTKNLSVFEHFVELALKGLVWKMLLGEYFQSEPRIFLHSQYLYIQYRDSVLRKMWDCKYCFSISLSRRFFNPISNPIHTTIITKKRFLKSNLRSESKFSYLHARYKTWKKWMSCYLYYLQLELWKPILLTLWLSASDIKYFKIFKSVKF